MAALLVALAWEGLRLLRQTRRLKDELRSLRLARRYDGKGRIL